jgi:hypothetical protein
VRANTLASRCKQFANDGRANILCTKTLTFGQVTRSGSVNHTNGCPKTGKARALSYCLASVILNRQSTHRGRSRLGHCVYALFRGRLCVESYQRWHEYVNCQSPRRLRGGSDGGYYGYDNPPPALDSYVGTTGPFVASADDATDTYSAALIGSYAGKRQTLRCSIDYTTGISLEQPAGVEICKSTTGGTEEIDLTSAGAPAP